MSIPLFSCIHRHRLSSMLQQQLLRRCSSNRSRPLHRSMRRCCRLRRRGWRRTDRSFPRRRSIPESRRAFPHYCRHYPHSGYSYMHRQHCTRLQPRFPRCNSCRRQHSPQIRPSCRQQPRCSYRPDRSSHKCSNKHSRKKHSHYMCPTLPRY